MATTVTATGTTGQTNTANKTTSKNNTNLNMNDFFNLLAAQLKNQSMLSPVDNSQLLSQMAQFSSLSSTQQLNNTFSSFLSVSYIGKNVKAQVTDSSGKTQKIEGIAEKVEFLSGTTYITVNGTRITPDAITAVTADTTSKAATTDKTTTPATDTTQKDTSTNTDTTTK